MKTRREATITDGRRDAAANGTARQGPDSTSGGSRLSQRRALEQLIDSSPRMAARTFPTPASAVVQRVTAVAANERTPHALVGDASMSDQAVATPGDRPIVIEVMEGNVDSAKAKIDNIRNSTTQTDNRAIMIALNQKVRANDVGQGTMLKNNVDFQPYGDLVANAVGVAAYAQNAHVQGGCFPAVWSATSPDVGGYTFPFLEMRAHVTRHPGTAWLLDRQRNAGGIDPVMRSMDADVTGDPLLQHPLSALPVKGMKAINDLGRTPYEERQVQVGVNMEDTAADMNLPGADIVSGGYLWSTQNQDAAFWGAGFDRDGAAWNAKLAACLGAINDGEHDIRARYAEVLPKAVYWPEPNSYMTAHARVEGAAVAAEAGRTSGDNAQQRESNYYVRGINDLVGRYIPELETTKPLKKYFARLVELIKVSGNGDVDTSEVEKFVKCVHQTHLSPEHMKHITGWQGVHGAKEGVLDQLELVRINVLARVTTAVARALRG